MPENCQNSTESYSSTNHEMTNISVISPMVDTLVYQTDSHTRAQHKLGGDIFIPAKRTHRGEFIWTNFHCLLCVGIAGFVVFWTLLLLRSVWSTTYGEKIKASHRIHKIFGIS